MAKWIKRLLGLAAIGGAVAGLVYYFKDKNVDADEFEDCFEDNDFDLDSDLKPADREYVSLTPTADAEKAEKMPAADTEKAEETPTADSEEAENDK